MIGTGVKILQLLINVRTKRDSRTRCTTSFDCLISHDPALSVDGPVPSCRRAPTESKGYIKYTSGFQYEAQDSAQWRLLQDTFTTDPFWTLGPVPFCAQFLAMFLVPRPSPAPRAPAAVPVPSDTVPPRLGSQPPWTQAPASPAPFEAPQRPLGPLTHLSSLSDMTPAQQRLGSASQTHPGVRKQRVRPPHTATRALSACACAVTQRQSLPVGRPAR